ncbi:MAG: helix-turn-helix domain-containing protein [Bacteroidota bacterium]
MEIDNIWVIIFVGIAFQGVLLSVILFAQNSANQSNLFLAVMICLFSISILDTLVYWTKLYETYPHLLGVSLPFIYAYGPLFYMYLKNIKNGSNKPSMNDRIHFLPFILVICWYLPYYFTNAKDKLEVIANWHDGFVNAALLPLLGLISLICYSWVSYKHMRKLEDNYNLSLLYSRHWFGVIFWSFSLFVVFHIMYFATILLGYSTQLSDVFIALGYSIFIYTIGYLGLRMSKLFNGIKLDSSKYQTGTLTKDLSKRMYKKVEEHLLSTKSFKNNELKLPILAKELSLSPHQLSQIINQNGNLNFSEFINSYRIEEAKRLIVKIDRINTLAYEVGFNNRTSFNKAFKKYTGLTPSEYKKSRS